MPSHSKNVPFFPKKVKFTKLSWCFQNVLPFLKNCPHFKFYFPKMSPLSLNMSWVCQSCHIAPAAQCRVVSVVFVQWRMWTPVQLSHTHWALDSMVPARPLLEDTVYYTLIVVMISWQEFICLFSAAVNLNGTNLLSFTHHVFSLQLLQDLTASCSSPACCRYVSSPASC